MRAWNCSGYSSLLQFVFIGLEHWSRRQKDSFSPPPIIHFRTHNKHALANEHVYELPGPLPLPGA